MSTYAGKIVEFHILQSFPVSCLNRDEMGTPKTAVIGGVTRARVSSQCWKRQVRMALHELEPQLGIKLGIRTKHVSEELTKACVQLGAKEDDAIKIATAMAAAFASTNTLCFVSKAECDALAQLAKEYDFKTSVAKQDTKQKGKKKEKGLAERTLDCLKKFQLDGLDALDIALFGRMMAQAPEINVEAAAAFSHAISTHKVATEFDFFTALDDLSGEDETGSAHMGTSEFDSATYYRYVSLDVGKLAHTLGIDDKSDNLKTAIEAFVRALYVAVPGARQATMSAACPWDYAHVFIRRGQRIQASFEKPVRAKDGFLAPSIQALEEWLDGKKSMMGSMFAMDKEFIWGVDSEFSIDKLVEGIVESI